MLDVRGDIRLAGQVLRYHTWPHIRKQTVAEHSWQVARIIMSIADHKMISILVPYSILHDCGEVTTGDIPFPLKKDNPDLKDIMDRLENHAVSCLVAEWNVHGAFGLHQLTIGEKLVFKLAEFIEMWEWGLEEQMLGNRFAEKVALRCYEVINSVYIYHNELPTYVRVAATAYMNKRLEKWGQYVS